VGRIVRQLLLLLIGAGAVAGERARNDYSNDNAWLCRPGRHDACDVDLTTTVVAADGALKRETFKPDPAAPVDCFYVYPTVSQDDSGNSDMHPGPEEDQIAAMQFARFASVCKPYAPLYRQFTRSALSGQRAADGAMAYGDVIDAWHQYLHHDNNGRGVVLIGHSQGAGILSGLMQHEIDGKPLHSRLVSAVLLGMNVAVPTGKDVGGTFAHVPLCRSTAQIGCVITYVSFRSNRPPPQDSPFGHVAQVAMSAACTNPAALRGSVGDLQAYLPATGRGPFGSAMEPGPWTTGAHVTTSWVSVPGLLTARCLSSDANGSFLEVSVHGDRADPRTDDIVGDVMTNGRINPRWGLHPVDVNLALGNLLVAVREQARAYLRSHRKS
jgi:hypothetical protein